MPPTLAQVAAAHPYPDFRPWWPLGREFCTLMRSAMLPEWSRVVPAEEQAPAQIQAHLVEYIGIVYDQEARPGLASAFLAPDGGPIASGEFDALSYCLFRIAFTHLAPADRRAFTRRVGKRFFDGLSERLGLRIDPVLDSGRTLANLETNLQHIFDFLTTEGYLRTHGSFQFDVDLQYRGARLQQLRSEFIPALNRGQTAFALYSMGFPVILPSAVYLFHIMGEAQHHSSRTVQELFDRMGCIAGETADFDPTGYPPGQVVELWEICKTGV